MIWDDDGLVSESRWISRTLPLSEIFLSSSLQKSSSLSLSWQTGSLRPSKEKRELKRSSFTSVDSGGAERDWKLYRKQKSKLISSTLHQITCTNIRFVRLLSCWWRLRCLTAKYIFQKKELREMIPKRFPELKDICKRRLFQKKMIRWESDWWLYNKTLMKCFSVSLLSQQDLLKSTMILFF